MDEDVLQFLVNGDNKKPHIFPSHPYFDDMGKIISWPGMYKNGFVVGQYLSSYWRSGSTGERAGVSLILPGIKELQGWYDALKFVDWLCSLVKIDGFIGFIVEEDNRNSMSVLYSIGGKLFFRDEKTLLGLISFSTGEPCSKS
jgi:hypothetical protein